MPFFQCSPLLNRSHKISCYSSLLLPTRKISTSPCSAWALGTFLLFHQMSRSIHDVTSGTTGPNPGDRVLASRMLQLRHRKLMVGRPSFPFGALSLLPGSRSMLVLGWFKKISSESKGTSPPQMPRFPPKKLDLKKP